MPKHVPGLRTRAVTVRANKLTPRATLPAMGGAPLPAGPLRVFADALDVLGYDVPALLAAAGVGRPELSDPDALVPCVAYSALICGAIAQHRLPNLGAHVAFRTPMGAFPLLDYLVLTTNTVGDALHQLQHYFHITSSPCRLEIVKDREAVRLEVWGGADGFTALYTAALAVHHLGDETDGRLRVSCVSLMGEPDDRHDLERLLGCPVRAPATWTGVEFPRETLATPLRRRDPVLRAVLEGQAAGIAGSPMDSVATRVRAVLRGRIGSGSANVGPIARQLAMAARTLQRHLAAEGVSFKELVDLARQDVAERLLADRSLSVAEVGYLIGFSEPSAFHRAFKRWRGMTPVEYRRAHVS